jgi:class 3 adenylate cyclase
MGHVRSRTFVWRFDQPVEAMWPLLSDTARFNEAARLPRHEIEEIAQPDGSVLYLGRVRVGPFRLEWQEVPVTWVSGQWFEHCRRFRRGPLASLCATFTLAPEGKGSRGTYRIDVAPRNLLGWLILVGGFLKSAGRTFGRLAASANLNAAGASDQPFDYTAPAPDAATQRRVEAMVAAIEATPHGHGMARRLADHVLTAQEVDLWHIRPLALARQWGIGERPAIELCLQAVKSGLLELRWDLLCPRCRIAKGWSGALDRLPRGAHCSTCNIDYDRDFSRNVEASFRPAAAVRALATGEYCLFGPMSTPHIKLQVSLAPGETRSLPAALEPGPYRLRTLEPGPEADIDWPGGGFPEVAVSDDDVAAGPAAPAGTVRLANAGKRARVAIVESRAWVQDALTADRITTLQAFRDLFADAVLRPGDEVGIAQVTLMFTDLRGSTALYERIGDARAYHLVREHFAFLAGQIRAHDGAIVKTIGDAVMAAFADPARAVAAALAIQRNVAAFNAGLEGGAELVIKIGLHGGPCIAVTLNDRLDYFGTTVNMAARLQAQSRGDIVLSAALLADQSVRALLATETLTPDTATMKGFDRPVAFHRAGPAG